MLSLDEFLRKANDKAKIFKNFRLEADSDITSKLTICIPDMHLLERGPNDDFFDRRLDYEERFISLLDFLLELRESGGVDLEVIQLGDMFDLWQADGHTNLIEAAYPNVLGLLDELGTIYVVGNHDIELVKWYKNKGATFKRKWRYFSSFAGKPRVIYEHGFQADFANNQASWSGAIGMGITKIVGMIEHLEPDIDVILGNVWASVSGLFSEYNRKLTPVKDTDGTNTHEYKSSYIRLMEKYNQGNSSNPHAPTDLAVAVIGHTHSPRLVQEPKDGKVYYLMDCGSWVNGGHEIGVISGKDIAVCQWG